MFLTPRRAHSDNRAMSQTLSEISLRILEVMKLHPEGISEGEIREILQIASTEQANFGRRRRELNYVYLIEKRKQGAKVLYVYKGLRPQARDTSPIGIRLRAQALHFARGRCGNCGRTIGLCSSSITRFRGNGVD